MTNKIVNFLKSLDSVLIALILSLIVQLKHSVISYATLQGIISNSLPNWLDYIMGFLFSASISLSIAIYTLRNRKYIAYFYLIVEIFINLIYIKLSTNTYPLGWLVSLLFLCIIIPVTIASYSHETENSKILDNKVIENNITDLTNSINTFKQEVTKELNNKISKGKNKMEIADKDYNIVLK